MNDNYLRSQENILRVRKLKAIFKNMEHVSAERKGALQASFLL